MAVKFQPDATLEESCRTMLATRGFEVLRVANEDAPQSADDRDNYHVVLGFSGAGVNGNLLIRAPEALLTESHPAPGQGLRRADLIDWAGEVANEMLGRFKTRCAVQGIHFSMGIPTVVTGQEVPLLSRRTHGQTVVWLQCGKHSIGASLELQLKDSATAEGVVPAQVLSEDELLMF